MAEAFIRIRGARQHNLKNVSLDIPRDQLVVITGVSGSGKSSLAFDTIYAEGQRRYVESLSSYARQFLGQTDKPDVDLIEGLSPAISIDQKTTSHNPRSTVGTVTEIYDYLRLLYARVGVPHCPICGKEVRQQTVEQIVDRIMVKEVGTRLEIRAPIIRGKKGSHERVIQDMATKGYTRARIDGELIELEDADALNKNKKHHISIVVDRVIVKEGLQSRLAESVEHSLTLADGLVEVGPPAGDTEIFSSHLACATCNRSLEELTPRMFSFNAPYGACPACNGLGYHLELDQALIIGNSDLSVNQGVVLPFARGQSRFYPELLRKVMERRGYDVHTAYNQLPDAAHQLILYGDEEPIVFNFEGGFGRSHAQNIRYQGVISILQRRFAEASSDAARQEVEGFMTSRPCAACHGQRLKPEVLAVTVGQLSIADVSELPIEDTQNFFAGLSFGTKDQMVAEPILKEVIARLSFLKEVGLGYLTLSRSAGTLSGGEAQRIRLATQIGSSLVGVLYILDEPSIGLHQRDNDRLIGTLERLRDLGNTVLVVEHDEDTMRAADWLIDMGPGPGVYGGEVVAAGTPYEVMASPQSLTGRYLSGQTEIAVPSHRRVPSERHVEVQGAQENNLKNVDVTFPLGLFIAVTGVSGSGKSTLVNSIVRKAMELRLNGAHSRKVGAHTAITGMEHLDKIVAIDQSPIGRTPRSNPATYTGAFDLIREIFANTPEANVRGYRAGRFSFNLKGGRCEACRGDGILKIEMHFLPDVYVPCEVCKGHRYNRETLEVTFRGKTIANVLDMTVDEAARFFANHPRLKRKLDTLHDVGLGYIRLGQPATTLSGGEAQRVKLATELSRRSEGRTFYILDEPTTGLHLEDVRHLLSILERLVNQGDTVLVIEHNLDVIKVADWIIDLGPEGGTQGGQIIATGPPEEVMKHSESYTGTYLKRHLERGARPNGNKEAITLRDAT